MDQQTGSKQTEDKNSIEGFFHTYLLLYNVEINNSLKSNNKLNNYLLFFSK